MRMLCISMVVYFMDSGQWLPTFKLPPVPYLRFPLTSQTKKLDFQREVHPFFVNNLKMENFSLPTYIFALLPFIQT